jgi:hypothetical protein
MWIYGSGFPKSLNIGKAIDKKLGKEREVIGKGKPMSSLGVMHDDDWQSDSEYNETKGNSEYEGWGTALKPAHEPVVMARKPFKGSVADNVLKHRTGAINIDESRISLSENDDSRLGGKGTWKTDKMAKDVYEGGYDGTETGSSELGRFPANLIHDGSDAVKDIFPHTKSGKMKQHIEGGQYNVYGKMYPRDVETYGDEGSAARFFYSAKVSASERNKGMDNEQDPRGRFPANIIHDGSDVVKDIFPNNKAGSYKGDGSKSGGIWSKSTGQPAGREYGDEGSASRYFYSAKVSASERNKGLEHLETKQTQGGGGGIGDYKNDVNSASGKYGSEKAPSKNTHPTVKPVDLMKYLCRLVTPKGGTVLDPFMGSGSTGIAAKSLEFNFIGIEREKEYYDIASARVNASSPLDEFFS